MKHYTVHMCFTWYYFNSTAVRTLHEWKSKRDNNRRKPSYLNKSRTYTKELKCSIWIAFFKSVSFYIFTADTKHWIKYSHLNWKAMHSVGIYNNMGGYVFIIFYFATTRWCHIRYMYILRFSSICTLHLLFTVWYVI